MGQSVKENVDLKTSDIKYPENLGHYENTKSKSDRNRAKRRNPGQRYKKNFSTKLQLFKSYLEP